jgi:aryl-alcohol dehydrogenase-like predicted oxidoreductase
LVGFGCWAIGGPWQSNGQPAGWGQVDDQESVAAIRRGRRAWVSLFDTADAYGWACEASPRRLGTDRIDLYQLHPGEVDAASAEPVLASLCRSPLGMGLLTGKYRPGSGWARTTCARPARSAVTIPIPGFKTVAQAEENAHAMAFGPLNDQQMREVDTLLHSQAQP